MNYKDNTLSTAFEDYDYSYPSSYGGGGGKLKLTFSGTFEVIIQCCNDVSKVPHQKSEVRILLVLEKRRKHLAGKKSHCDFGLNHQ